MSDNRTFLPRLGCDEVWASNLASSLPLGFNSSESAFTAKSGVSLLQAQATRRALRLKESLFQGHEPCAPIVAVGREVNGFPDPALSVEIFQSSPVQGEARTCLLPGRGRALTRFRHIPDFKKKCAPLSPKRFLFWLETALLKGKLPADLDGPKAALGLVFGGIIAVLFILAVGHA
jgi:hypothetical protein